MRIDTGIGFLNELLKGGFEDDTINTVFGPAGSGKTTTMMYFMIRHALEGKKVLYIETESGFSTERLRQITPDYSEVLKRIIFLKPVSFDELSRILEKLRGEIDKSVYALIIDSVGTLYRYELGKKDNFEMNRLLGVQLSYLSEIVRKQGVPVLLTDQVYSDVVSGGISRMVGGDVIKYTSKLIVELKKLKDNKRQAFIYRHRSIAEKENICFRIVQEGFVADS